MEKGGMLHSDVQGIMGQQGQSGQQCVSHSAENERVLFLWDWVRVPTGRTASELQEVINILMGIDFDFNSQESWKWVLANDGVFSVKRLSSLLDERILKNNNSSTQKTLRNNLVPKKLEIFVWRALKKRLPVRTELDKRGIDLHSVRCPICDGDLETVDHSLVNCKLSSEIWVRIYKWWNFGNCVLINVDDTLLGKSPLIMSSLGKKVWQGVEWVCSYYLRKIRNSMVFQNKTLSAPVLLNEIQVKSFEWISSRIKGIKIEWLNWLSNHSMYLDI
ncbi:uncharacterized protein [Rutidosis leptorrhynchoides]|uniref:uncharacterized protein n=1 Tax=Rutidosis leptorrhynchoides TaxID=125765 RepID=UPI003A98D1D2